MSAQYERLEKCYEYYRSVTDFVPRVGLILGSGLGGYAKNMKVEKEIPYGDIPGFPVSTVEGHDGRFLLGYIGNVPAVVMKGRVHYYEGYPMDDVVLPIRLMRKMGAEVLFLTNAAGGVNYEFQAGDFTLTTAKTIHAPMIEEAFMNMECTLKSAEDLSGAGITAMVTGQVQHVWVDKEYARGYEKRYGKDGFMMLVPAPQDLVTGEPSQSAIATVDIEMLD